ncbi:aldo/keto reductase [Roseivivax sediminis]|uniref:Predicted oxidoreductase n=1 Tax=Roseivivax sediminis TaxID=936889 RepID=A0A1I2A4N7_9RHOB|nr:aldo/keto reductase [Roseivivax sediminis]SFE38548.1 Predicted oxidoreductase [Roseivivax sediminis]
MTVSRLKLASDLELSRIAYGMWRLSDDADTSPARVRGKIEACLAQGITTMDQADIYGGYAAEEVLGAALKGTDLRDRIEIVTKCGIVAPAGRHADRRVKHYDTSAAHIEASVDQSLELMGIDRIDLLLIHRPDPLMDHHETGAALDGVIAAGKVAHVGVSNFKLHDWTLLQSAMNAKLLTNQIELSLSAPEGFTNGDVAFLQERGVPIMAWSPLGGGALFDGSRPALSARLEEIAAEAGVEPSAVAVAWLLAHPARILPVMGTNTLSRIARLGEAEALSLDRETWFELYTLALGREVP